MNYQFDEIISAPCRLGILATLVPGELVSFTEMKAATSLSDGNLHTQTRKLADVGYIEHNKIMNGRRSVTKFRITELGHERLRLYVMTLQKILDAEKGPKEKGAKDLSTKATGTKETGTKAICNKDTEAKRPAKRSRQADDSAVWA